MGDRYRVVQWATGNIGLRSLRAVIEHPDLELVGLYVYSEDKAGRESNGVGRFAPPPELLLRTSWPEAEETAPMIRDAELVL